MEMLYFVSPETDRSWREDAKGYAQSGVQFYATDIEEDADIHFLTELAKQHGYLLRVDGEGRFIFSKIQPEGD